MPLPHEETDQPIIAYRAWHESNGRLCSVATASQAWPPMKPFHAQCMKQSFEVEYHQAPIADCSCGIYAMRTVEALLDTLHYTPQVLGRIALWGDVVVCERGYRAEYAYPQLLFWGGNMEAPFVRELAAKYGCEAAPLPDDLMNYVELHVKQIEEYRSASASQGYVNSYAQWTNIFPPSQANQQSAAALISVGTNTAGQPQAHTTMVTQSTYQQMVAQAAQSMGISPSQAAAIVNQQNHNTSNPPALQVNTPNGWRIPIWQRSAKKKKP